MIVPVAVMGQGCTVELSAALALVAARLSVEMDLPVADSIMLATARAWNAPLWTQDAHFDGVSGARYVARRSDKKSG